MPCNISHGKHQGRETLHEEIMGTQSRAREERVRWAGVIQQDAVGKVGGPDSDNREAKACLSGPG